ncbi:MAG: MFS transporter [SAR202 cluster bacterium]|nr:MFS transporter [SAR202 cluster bacterium]
MNSYIGMAIWQGFTAFFLPILRDFGVSRTLLSGAFSIRQVESGFLSPLVGYIIDRTSPRKVIIIGILMSGLGLILTGLSTNIINFYLAFILMSAGVSFSNHSVAWSVMVTRWFNKKRGRATGLTFMGGAFGGPSLIFIAILLESYGWRSSVIILGIGMWAIGIPLALVARSRPEDYGYLPDGDTEIDSDIETTNVTQEHDTYFTLKQAMSSKYFWGIIAVFSTQSISIQGLLTHQIAYLEGIGFSTTVAASTVGIYFGVSGIGRFIVGFLTDRFDWQRVFIAMVIGQVIGLIMLANVSIYPHAAAAALFMGFSHGMMVPIRLIISSKLFGTNNLGSIWGTVDGITLALGVIGPVYLGWTFDTFGSYVPALYILSFVLFTAIPMILIIFSKKSE